MNHCDLVWSISIAASVSLNVFPRRRRKGACGSVGMSRLGVKLRSPGRRANQSAIHLVDKQPPFSTIEVTGTGYAEIALRRAQNFLKVLKREHGDPTILNNLKLLDESLRFLFMSPRRNFCSQARA